MIFNRKDCCKSRLNNIDVKVDSGLCARIGRAQAVNKVYCNIMGKSVTVRHTRSAYLTLCEVQVFGRYIQPDFNGRYYKVQATSSKFTAPKGGVLYRRESLTKNLLVRTSP